MPGRHIPAEPELQVADLGCLPFLLHEPLDTGEGTAEAQVCDIQVVDVAARRVRLEHPLFDVQV
jgi:hypothetical protein